MATLGSNAPFIGLFGTVLGIIQAFAVLASTNAGTHAVMSGISEALVATAIGLFVAIPAVIAYNIFSKKLNPYVVFISLIWRMVQLAGETPSYDEEMGDLISTINVTPFVDVVLVLLVIFIVTAPTLLKDVILVKLPKATQVDSKSAQSIGVAVTREGQILLNGTLAAPESVIQTIKQTIESNPETHAIISADAESRHKDVVRAIDLIKSAGLSRFAIQIEHE